MKNISKYKERKIASAVGVLRGSILITALIPAVSMATTYLLCRSAVSATQNYMHRSALKQNGGS